MERGKKVGKEKGLEVGKEIVMSPIRTVLNLSDVNGGS